MQELLAQVINTLKAIFIICDPYSGQLLYRHVYVGRNKKHIQ